MSSPRNNKILKEGRKRESFQCSFTTGYVLAPKSLLKWKQEKKRGTVRSSSGLYAWSVASWRTFMTSPTCLVLINSSSFICLISTSRHRANKTVNYYFDFGSWNMDLHLVSPCIIMYKILQNKAENGSCIGEGVIQTTIISPWKLPRRQHTRCWHLHWTLRPILALLSVRQSNKEYMSTITATNALQLTHIKTQCSNRSP